MYEEDFEEDLQQKDKKTNKEGGKEHKQILNVNKGPNYGGTDLHFRL